MKKPNDASTTTLLLVRHGTTEWVDTHLLHGITDIPLNDRGREQAKMAAKALADSGAQKMVTSSLSRCVETAEIIGKTTGLEPVHSTGLVEVNFGWMEGRKIRDHDYGEYGKAVEFFDHHMFNIIRFLSGESKARVEKRVLRTITPIYKENPFGTVIIVTHSGVINTILFHFFGNEFLGGDAYYHLNPCSITEIRVNPEERAHMIRLNDQSHVPEDLKRT